MKFILVLSLSFLSLQTHADTIYSPANLTHSYRVDSNAQKIADKIATPYLKVVKEQLNFRRNGVQRETLLEALDLVETIINSQAFKRHVIGYINSNGNRSYTRNEGLTNEQIYLKLMEGREVLDPDTPGEMNLYIQLYHRFWSRVIGYTKIGTSKWMWINWRFYKNFSAAQMASNIVHEWIHLMGFYHDSAQDHDSVPYAIGFITGKLAEIYLKTGKLD